MTTPTQTEVEVAVIGGGIGGLTVANLLSTAGHDVHVYEKWPDFGEIGGHLTIDTAAIEVLERFGADQEFLNAAQRCEGIEIRNSSDASDIYAAFPIPDLGSMGLDDPNRMGSREVWAFLRSDLIKLLAARMDGAKLHPGVELVSLADNTDGAVATFADGSTVKAQLLVAADGVRSQARAMFDDSPSVHAGVTICRGLTPREVMPDDITNDRLRFWDGWAEGEVTTHMLTAPVMNGDYVSVDVLLQGGDQLDDVDKFDVPIQRILDRLAPTTDQVMIDLITKSIEPFVAHGLYDRETATTWVGERTTILGDAAHAMRPTLGQGACQSMHDAAALTDAIAKQGLGRDACLDYESVRKPYVQQIVQIAKGLKIDPKAWKDGTPPGPPPGPGGH